MLFTKVLKEEYLNKYNKKSLLLLRAFLLYYRNPRHRVAVLMRRATKGKNDFLRRRICKKLMVKYGVEFSRKTTVGKNLSIQHFNGIVVGGGSVIGDNCTLYQQVTLGQKDDKYPTLGNNVTVYSGAKIIGDIKIGNNSVIGANAVVVKDVPADSTAVGVPARIITK